VSVSTIWEWLLSVTGSYEFDSMAAEKYIGHQKDRQNPVRSLAYLH